ncbi:hypothetical protein GCM10012275_32380 [Longimycelium tulufanense]|uniref:Uncharacterized protein n=1 Tax=Longimycelium tulufanense TaxID=907463 RepID=A0A8J3FX39_9PSEU|nr:hypothetical protein GCM10012275_32380 [Longimycelium tulufanense]
MHHSEEKPNCHTAVVMTSRMVIVTFARGPDTDDQVEPLAGRITAGRQGAGGGCRKQRTYLGEWD